MSVSEATSFCREYRRLDELMAENRELKRRLALAEYERDTAKARQQ